MKTFKVTYKKENFGQEFIMTINDLNEVTTKDIRKRLDDRGYIVLSVRMIK